MSFQQSPPRLGNQYEDDRVLRSYLTRALPDTMLAEIAPELRELGQLAGGDLYQMQIANRLEEPTLTQWDAWGNRVDTVAVTPLWREAERIAVAYGLVATAYEQRHGSLSRVHQAALAYLFTPSTDIYSCPLAMTDGAARTLISSGNQSLIQRAVPHLISRNPKDFWTAGQWMTELTGGSDVGASQTIARREGKTGSAEQWTTASQQPVGDIPSSELEPWRLYGDKWFASAINSQMALTLARPEGNPAGGRGLALFYLELRDESGRLRNIQINRLKDKLGTRKVPTAELSLVGTPAQLVMGSTDGIRNIAPLLNITRLWNGISAVALMRRGLALALAYAHLRFAFGGALVEKSLHRDTLAGLEAEAEAGFQLAFFVAELTGRVETATGAHEGDALLLRLLTPLMKLTTARQAVLVISEVLEAFGGAGYVEDTGLPQLLRDAQVLPIWEGTTNVLSLDTLRALGVRRPTETASRGASDGDQALQAFKVTVTNCLQTARDPRLSEPVRLADSALAHADVWLNQTRSEDSPRLEAGARRLALTLGRTMALALLIQQAQWSIDHEADVRATAAARRFALSGIDLLVDNQVDDSRALFS
jgi:alkylation response protein AidB-like acyl-CoA dehydrogenase